LTVVVGLGGALHYYIGARLIRDTGVPAPFSTVAWAALFTFFFTLPLGFIAGRKLSQQVARVFEWLAFGWMGAFALLLVTVALSDLVFAVVLANIRSPDPLYWSRIQAYVVLGLVVPSLVVGFLTARGKPK